MPTNRHGKVRRLLKGGQAKVIKSCPFTIQLLYATTAYLQFVSLGVDAGSKEIGTSATTDKLVLHEAEIALRTNVVNNISTRRECRRARRNRKTRYRKPRFNNRKRKNGWLAPSVEQKINSHIQVIKQIHNVLPISSITVEVAAFDIQKIKNPDITGTEYQEGEQLNSWNIREYVLYRDNHTCQCCRGKSGDKVLETHHIESRKTGGDAPNNLVTLCKTCHEGHHNGTVKLPDMIRRGASFKDAAFMGIMRWELVNKLRGIYPEVNITYGYITKNERIKNGLDKSHRVDARCISDNPNAKPPEEWYRQKCVRSHNRQIHKMTISKGGYRKLNQSPKYVKSYQLFDAVTYNGQRCFVFGRRASGSFDIRKLDGTKISAGISYKKLKPSTKRRTILTEIVKI